MEISNEAMKDWLCVTEDEGVFRVAKKREMFFPVSNGNNVDKNVDLYEKIADVTLTDVMYVEESEQRQCFHWYDVENRHMFKKEQKLGYDRNPELTGYEKNIGWNYEQEVRIRVELKEMDESLERIAIKLPCKFARNLKIMTGPYFDHENHSRNEIVGLGIESGNIDKSRLEKRVNFRGFEG